MNISSQVLTLPLSQADCQWAELQASALCHLQNDDPSNERHDSQKNNQNGIQQEQAAIAHQIQHSTLASLAARYYLRLLGITSKLTTATSTRDPDNLLTTNRPIDYPHLLIGELTLESNQRLHCLPIIAGQALMSTSRSDHPPNSDNLGTIAIQLNLPQQTAQVIGFLPGVSLHLQTPASQLTDPAFSPGVLHKLPPLQPVAMLINQLSASPITHLQQWLMGRFAANWQQRRQTQPMLTPCFRSLPSPQAPDDDDFSHEIEATLLHTIRHSTDDEQRWQAAEQLWNHNPTHPESPILRTKDMGLYLLGHNITLLVGILTKPNQERLILVRLLPSGDQPYLPKDLTLAGQDESGDTVFSIQSRHQDDYIQFKFTAASGDRFQLNIGWSTASLIEQFIV